MKLLLYCTKAKPYLAKMEYSEVNADNGEITWYQQYGITTLKEEIQLFGYSKILNGKIVAECDFEVEEIEKGYGIRHTSFDEEGYFDDFYDYMTKTIDEDILLKRSCLNIVELETYNPNYAIHIKNLHIFDEPKELSEVYKIEDVGGMLFTKPLTNAPQNIMRVSINHWDYAAYEPNDINVLISIHPEWLCKILNGEKTIDVRKKVLMEMLK